MDSLGIIAGLNGAELLIGAQTYVPTGRHKDKKIVAIGVETSATVSQFKFTKNGVQYTSNSDNWLGTLLDDSKSVNAFIPLGAEADEITTTIGNIWVYFANK